MIPVIKNKNDFDNPVLNTTDGVPTVVSLYHDHKPGESSKHHSHDWEHQVYITRGTGILWVDEVEYQIKKGDSNNNGSVKDPDKIISFKSL